MELRVAAAALLLAACGAISGGDDDDDDVVMTPDAGVVPPGPGADYVFDESKVRIYRLTVAPADWQWLNDNALLEQYVPAMLEFEGASYGPIGVRYKGGYGNLTLCFQDGARVCPKLSIKLKFSEYDPEGRFYGLKRLNFHSMRADPSQMRDRLAYAMYREMDVAAPRAGHARLVVNGEDLGLFALIEQIDGRFTRSRFADGGEGNLYKEVWPRFFTEQPYLDALKTNRDENPTADKMVRFATALAGANDSTIEGVLDGWMDVDALMRYLAVDRAIENWDGIVGWYCGGGGFCFNHNYYWYEETGQDRVWLIPWDMDNTWHVPNPITDNFGMAEWDDTTAACDPIPLFNGIMGRAPACDPFIRWMATVYYDRYLAATEAFLDGPFQLDVMLARIDVIEAQIRDHVASDGNGPGLATWEAAVTDLRSGLAALHAETEAVVGR